MLANVVVVDEPISKRYPKADKVVVKSTNRPGSTGSTDPETTDIREEIDLAGAEGEAELEPATYIFEVVEDTQTIGRRTRDLGPESDHIALSVDPHVVEAMVTGGPDREPLAEATVEVAADAGGLWTEQKPTDSKGTVRFEVPRSASTVAFNATYEDLPPAESEHRVEEAAEQGVILPIADGTGAMTVETMVGDRAWPNVEVGITPISADAKTITEGGTVRTASNGRQTIEDLPTGEYEVTAHPQVESVETTAAVERITVEDGGTVEVALQIGISYTMSTAQRERLEDIRNRIGGLASVSDGDETIPQYYGTVLTSVLDVVTEVEASTEHFAESNVSPDETVEALLDATERGLDAVSDMLSERRVAEVLQSSESMPPARVTWTGDTSLDAFLNWVDKGGDYHRRILRDRLNDTDDVLDEKWGDVIEIAPARKLHDRLTEMVRETGEFNSELAVAAQAYVGIGLLNAIEELFEYDALVARLNSRVL